MGRSTFAFLTTIFLWLLSVSVTAEIVYFKNGDVLHGTIVSANALRVTVETAYGRLSIPKKDIQRIEYEGASAEKQPKKKSAAKRKASRARSRSAVAPAKPLSTMASFEIRGGSFWYAFESPPDNPADLRLRLRIFLGETEAAMLLDTKPDTFNKNTYYNSFTFSPTDSQVVRTGIGYRCRVVEAEDGRVVLNLELPEKQVDEEFLLRMLYQINEGSRELPRWIDAVSRSFPIQIEAGKQTYVVVEQDASRLDYSGFFRKTMKNLETFQLRVLSSEMRDPSAEPER